MGTYQRNPKIDCLRGIAILAMVTYHLIFDLHEFGYAFFHRHFIFRSELLTYPPYFIAGTFLLLVGISASFKAKTCSGSGLSDYFKIFSKRSFQVLLAALGVTLSSILWFPQGKIYFGILHCIGTTQLLLILFLNYYYLNLILGTLIIGLGIVTAKIPISFPWLLWLGFLPPGINFGDYFPLLPWSGFAFLGIFLGKALYPTILKDNKGNSSSLILKGIFNGLTFLGRHPLIIYLIQQPLLMTSLYLLSRMLR